MFRRITVLLALVPRLLPTATAEEDNYWPLRVERDAPPPALSESHHLGPIHSEYEGDGGSYLSVVRPLVLQASAGDVKTGSFLYPLFTWESRAGEKRFSFFSLVNRRDHLDGEGRATGRALDVWPFYFSRDTGDPATSYRALMPLHGKVRSRLGLDEMSWDLFPLSLTTRRGERVTKYSPWPIVRRTQGGGHEGFAVWPLFGRMERAGDYRDEYWLWPLAYRSGRNLGGAEPDLRHGILPLYTREQGAGYDSASYLWPFFGYTHRVAPTRYDEMRYLWPLLVQGRGDGRRINRWAPFYSHSMSKGVDKTWVLWPAYRRANWSGEGVAQEKTQFLYFVYWSQRQTSLAHPSAPAAERTHLWPLVSAWDNGAGRMQLQMPSPLEVFFPQNESVRRLYTPLFAVFRYDRRGPGEVRCSLLWDAVTWRRSEGGREFHAGPFFGYSAGPAHGRVSFGAGLFGWRRAEDGWHAFVFDFRGRKSQNASLTNKP